MLGTWHGYLQKIQGLVYICDAVVVYVNGWKMLLQDFVLF